VLGPGMRYVLWVQGCKKRCPGCVYPQGRIIGANGYWLSVDEIVAEINNSANLTGITVSGGEPFLQAEPLAELVNKIKKTTSLDLMFYSGYTLDELRSRNDGATDYILNNIDLLIDGEYVEAKNTNLIYRGSDNQKIHFLSPKYLPFKQAMETTHNRNLEFVFRGDEVFIVGIPAKGFNETFNRKIIELDRRKHL